MTKKCFYCSYSNNDSATRCINCGMELNKYWQYEDGKLNLIDKRDKDY